MSIEKYQLSIVREVVNLEDMDLLQHIHSLLFEKNNSHSVESEMDTTEYLMRNEANRKSIMESIAQAERGELIKVKIEDL